MNFKGKTVLVTGAATGIGRAAAVKFAENDAKIVLVDIDKEKLECVKNEILKITSNVISFVCDVSDENKVYEMVEAAEKKFGKIDILINNAALWRDMSSFIDTPTENWRKFIDVNIMGTVYFSKAVLKNMIENNYGRIITSHRLPGCTEMQ